MHMATVDKVWTVDEVLALPDDGFRHEVIDGELYLSAAPSWRHGDAVQELYALLRDYLRANRVGEARVAPADLVFADRTMVQPDLFVVPLVGGRRPGSWGEAGRLLLAVEVLSPDSARRDRIIKRRLYQRQGVPEYWVVDTELRALERWRGTDERSDLLTESLEWLPEGASVPLVIDLEEYFANVHGS